MSRLITGCLGLVWRHRGKVLLLAITLGTAATVASVPAWRSRADTLANRALHWAGLVHPTHDPTAIYWCPMHPQIKRNQPDEVCPLCNMRLVRMTEDVGEHLKLTTRQVQQAGVAYRPIIRRRLYREIDTTGRIDYDERRLKRITSWVRGSNRIESLAVDFTGTHVEKGDFVAELYSPKLITLQHEFLLALKSESSGRRLSLADGARQQLLDQGLKPEQIDEIARTKQVLQRIPIPAPITGTVIARRVQEGDYVDEGEVLFEVADLSQLWLYADVYEEELKLVDVGQPATVSVRSFPERTFEGTVAFIDPVVDQESRTIRVRIDVPNPEGRLKPGMFARVRLRKDLGERLAIPSDACLHSGRRHIAIVREGDGLFRPREIRIDATWFYGADGETNESTHGELDFGRGHERFHIVLAGLNPGEEVVTSGAFLLNAESDLKSVLAKMLPPKSRSATLQEALGVAAAEGIREALDAYFLLTRTLAEDRSKDVSADAARLGAALTALGRTAAEKGMTGLAEQAERTAELSKTLAEPKPPKTLHEARAAYGRISREMIRLLENHGGQTLFGRDLYGFHCGMSKVGYENWLWWSEEKLNPYMGQSMPTCGQPLSRLAADAKPDVK